MRILRMIFFVLLWASSGAYAACSGAGTAWTCTAGSTTANVNSALSSAADGATITFEAGSYNWSSGMISSFSNTKGVTLRCATTHACTVSLGSGYFMSLAFSGTNTKPYRISGFTFTNINCGVCVEIFGNGTLHNLRIDNNRFTGANASVPTFWLIGTTTHDGEVYGVIDHNLVDGQNSFLFLKVLGPKGRPWGATPRGTSRNIFVEDNTFDFAQNNDLMGCVDAHERAAITWRFNKITNCRVNVHGVPHGGIKNFEVYRNTVAKTQAGSWGGTDCYRCIYQQGSGEWYVWDNVIRGATSTLSGSAIELLHYRGGEPNAGGYGICDGSKSVDGNTAPSSVHHGWPCWAQPGRMEVDGPQRWGKLAPVLIFRNTNGATGAKIDVVIAGQGSNPDYTSSHLVKERDYYNAVSASAQTSSSSPFNGTVGIGHGVLANRPASCTHTTAPDGDEGGGVMYWATDQGSWNSRGESGVMYRCSATNTWTTHYVPFSYPHPLQTGGSVAPPVAPTNLTVL
jgi:hypothetical protein